MDLTNTVALVTGTKRIGAVVAEQLAIGGADVALCYSRSRDEAEAAAERVRAAGRRAETLQADLSKAEGCRDLVERAVNALGRLDILVNMASAYGRRPFAELRAEDWDAALTIDLRAAFLCSQAAAPHMRRQNAGRIINISDWLAGSGRPRYREYLPYYVAKAGVKALTEAMALELAADGVLVNAIAPGPILAPPGSTAEELAEVERATPLGRWGGPLEIAKVVLALVDSDFITGETIRVDGGRHLR